MAAFSPILHTLVKTALAHLDQGWLYATSIPRRDVRLHLACMWPILIALKTLHLLTTCDNILDPAQQLKISRFEVYRIMAASTLTGGSRFIGTAYWGHLRKTIG
jgi:farnesyl-diphosphate farnesyltransferase